MNTIRKASLADIDNILSIYQSARVFMCQTGNMTQWAGAYPSGEVIEKDIAKGSLYICEDDAEILAVFYFAQEADPTYSVIYNGAWLNSLPYGVIHRIAVSDNARGKGVAGFIFDACFAQCKNLKIDTHKDNTPMRRALEKNGFVQCGIIHLLNGEERVAYQRDK